MGARAIQVFSTYVKTRSNSMTVKTAASIQEEEEEDEKTSSSDES